MSNVLSFEDFLNEGKPYVDPKVKIQQNIAKQASKVADLKKEVVKEPEKAIITKAKIAVELEKIDSMIAQKNLLNAKDFEEQRKAREKANALRDKASEAARKAKAK